MPGMAASLGVRYAAFSLRMRVCSSSFFNWHKPMAAWYSAMRILLPRMKAAMLSYEPGAMLVLYP